MAKVGVTVFGPRGLNPGGPVDITVINRTAGTVVKGSVVELDMALAAGESTDYDLGGTASGYTNFIIPSAGGTTGDGSQFYVHAILLEDIAQDAEGTARVYGKVMALVDDVIDQTTAVGDHVIVDESNHVMSSNPAETGKVAGLALVTTATTVTDTTGTLIPVFFNGEGGKVT